MVLVGGLVLLRFARREEPVTEREASLVAARDLVVREPVYPDPPWLEVRGVRYATRDVPGLEETAAVVRIPPPAEETNRQLAPVEMIRDPFREEP